MSHLACLDGSNSSTSRNAYTAPKHGLGLTPPDTSSEEPTAVGCDTPDKTSPSLLSPDPSPEPTATRIPISSIMHKRQLSQQIDDQPHKKALVEAEAETSEEDEILPPVPMQPIAILAPTTISSTSISSRRHAHILSEQRRRENINGGFKQLKNAVPFCKGTQDSKAMILKKAVEYIASLELQLNHARYPPARQPPPPPPPPPTHVYRSSSPPVQQIYPASQMPPPPPVAHATAPPRYAPIAVSYYYPESIVRPATTPPTLSRHQQYRRNYSLPDHYGLEVPPRMNGTFTPPPFPRP